MSDRQSVSRYILGSAVNITTMLNIDTADAATVQIKDPSLTVKVTANMTKDANKVYNYVYQSAANDQEGDYIATITITYQGYQAVYQPKFVLTRQE